MQLRSNGTLAVSKGQFESHSLVQWFKLHNHSLDGTYLTGGIWTFCTTYQYCHIVVARVFGWQRKVKILLWSSAGRCLIEIKSQEEVVWNGEGVPIVCVDSNVWSKHSSMLSRLFHSAVCFPQPFLPASPCILFMSQCTNKLSRTGPQGVTWCMESRSKPGWPRSTICS